MKRHSTSAGIVASGLEVAWESVAVSFERFCLTAGIATLSEMMERDAIDPCGARHDRNVDRRGYRWGRTVGRLGFRGGKVAVGFCQILRPMAVVTSRLSTPDSGGRQ